MTALRKSIPNCSTVTSNTSLSAGSLSPLPYPHLPQREYPSFFPPSLKQIFSKTPNIFKRGQERTLGLKIDLNSIFKLLSKTPLWNPLLSHNFLQRNESKTQGNSQTGFTDGFPTMSPFPTTIKEGKKNHFSALFSCQKSLLPLTLKKKSSCKRKMLRDFDECQSVKCALSPRWQRSSKRYSH